MIVVADTSPLNYLLLIDAIGVLPELFGEVHAPPAVMVELQHPRAPELARAWAKSPPAWLIVRSPSANAVLDPTLDPGEAEALALARELGASAILVDEKKGRRSALAQGIAVLGTITVLELAADEELIELSSALRALQHTSFHCTPILIEAALQRQAARKRENHGRPPDQS
jgi:predicted nucleic acid-binding protein